MQRVSAEGESCTMGYAKQNLRSALPYSPVTRRTGRSLDSASNSRVPLGPEAIQGAARNLARHGNESVVRSSGHVGGERRHSTAPVRDVSSLRADGAGRATPQTGHLARVLGARSASRRANRLVQCPCGAHRALPNGLERCSGILWAAGNVRVPSRHRGLPHSGRQRNSACSLRPERSPRRPQGTVRHRYLYCFSAGRNQSISRTARAPSSSAARESARVYTSIQSPRIQALVAPLLCPHRRPEHGGKAVMPAGGAVKHLPLAGGKVLRGAAVFELSPWQPASSSSVPRKFFRPHGAISVDATDEFHSGAPLAQATSPASRHCGDQTSATQHATLARRYLRDSAGARWRTSAQDKSMLT